MSEKDRDSLRTAPSSLPTEATDVALWTWADPGTWPASLKFLPAYVVLISIFITIYYNNYVDTGLDLLSYEGCVGSFNYSFRVNAALAQAHTLSKQSWEIGYAYEATQQIFNPERSVFAPNPFPGGKLPKLGLRLDEASLYIQHRFKSTNRSLFDEPDGTTTDPAAMGVAALQLSQKWSNKEMMAAASRQKDLLLQEAPRHSNGAISSRFEQTQLESDAVAMLPPFLAYYGVATDDVEIMREAVRQIGLYRDALMIKAGPRLGLWKHVVGSLDGTDEGAWSTGNAWVAYGIARTRAAIASWSKSNAALAKEIEQLDIWVQQIIDAVINNDDETSGLLRNYLGDSSWEGETSGTSLLAATTYRMAVIRKDVFAQDKYLGWANLKRRAILSRVDENGFIRPAARPLKQHSKETADVSAEGQSFLLLLGTAWRDCVCSSPNGVCLAAYLDETQSTLAGEISFERLTGFSFERLIDILRSRLQAVLNYFKGPGALSHWIDSQTPKVYVNALAFSLTAWFRSVFTMTKSQPKVSTHVVESLAGASTKDPELGTTDKDSYTGRKESISETVMQIFGGFLPLYWKYTAACSVIYKDAIRVRASRTRKALPFTSGMLDTFECR